MYNSFFINLSVKSWNYLQKVYRYSILHRISSFFIEGFKKLSRGSKVVELFISDRNLIEESFLFGLYGNLIEGINTRFNSINNYMKNIRGASLACNTICKLFSNGIRLKTTVSLFSIILGIGIIVANLIQGLASYKLYLPPLGLIIFTLLLMLPAIGYKEILEGSYVFNLIKDIFLLDEGVDQWW